MNPALMEMIAKIRDTEMRRTAATRHSSGWGHSDAIPAETRASAARMATHGPAAARRTIGWFLVRVGLHLALAQPGAVSA
jgi:hypothetical protein